MIEKNGSTPTGNPYDKGAPFLERVIFSKRPLFLLVFALLTLFLGYHALQLRPEASFLRMIPTYHPYIQNYITHQEDLKGLGNAVRISVETTEGTILSKEYLEKLDEISNEVFFINGVDRSSLKSLWSPATRWNEVTELGFESGPVISDSYDGSPESLAEVSRNIFKSGEIGRLVANDFKSSVINAPLMDIDPETGEKLDYYKLSQDLERIRTTYQSDTVKIHIVGFAKVVGDLIEGAARVVLFFAIAFVILLVFLYLSSRCLRSTVVRAASSLIAVVWQLGLLHILGYGLNPYSMLVPFLMFALGVSHGIQMGNAMAHEMMAGADKLLGARLAYRKVYVPGLAALVTDGIGFLTLFVILIGVIQDIAVGATIGVAVVAFTDLMLLPVLLSYTGISNKSIKRLHIEEDRQKHPFWYLMANLAKPKYAMMSTILVVIVLGYGFYARQDLKVGDLDPGAPELRPDSRYNLDNAYMTEHYSASSDLFVVMLKTPEEGNSDYNTLVALDRLEWKLRQLEGVQSTISLLGQVKMLNAGYNEGNLKWLSMPRSKIALDNMVVTLPANLSNKKGSLSPILVFLNDHKAETLQQVVATVEEFAAENNTDKGEFLLAAGNSGIEAATNIEIEKAQLLMTVLVYSVVFLVCLITYRSPRGALCVVAPLFVTTIMAEALMTHLGIGIKVATLPVIAVGVGIGVDYGIYIYNKLCYYLSQGKELPQAYYHTLKTTGKAVIFTGTTLSIGVGTWIFSPIKFQADMGILLTFMFFVNMVGALVGIPSLVQLLGASRKVRRASDAAKKNAVHEDQLLAVGSAQTQPE
jgi:predicted RND superfamily exporter protein